MERWPLPEGWEWRTLAELVEPTERRDPSLNPDQPFIYVDISSINNREGTISEVKTLAGREAPSRARKVIRRDDIILATTRPYLRNIALVPAEYDNQICSTGFCVLRSKAGVVEPRYLFHLCRSEVILDQLTPKMRGASYPAVTDSDVLDCEIPLPPLETQRRIVARLDALLAEVAAARRLHAEIVADTARVMEAVRDEVFSELARHAPRVQFSKIAESRLGKMLSQASKTGVYSKPYLRNANVLWDEFKLDDVYEMDFLPEEREEFLLKPGDLLICEGGEIGRCAVWEGQIEECYFQKALHRARLKDPQSPPRYLMHFIAWAAKHGSIAELRTGSAIPHLTGIKLKTLEVIWPEPEVQHRVVATLDQVKGQIAEMGVSHSENTVLLDQVEKAILAQAFRGEL